jgi:hypothetical protein
MGDLDSRCENCEREVERLRGEFDALRSEMIEVAGGVLARADEILAKVEASNRQMFADLQAQTDAGFADLRAQTDAGFARLRASIDAAPRTERRNDEPPKLN